MKKACFQKVLFNISFYERFMNISWRLGKIENVTLWRISTHFLSSFYKKSNFTLGFFVQCFGTNCLFLTLNKKYWRKCNKGWKSWHMHTLVSMHWIAIELVPIKMFYFRIVNDRLWFWKYILLLKNEYLNHVGARHCPNSHCVLT